MKRTEGPCPCGNPSGWRVGLIAATMSLASLATSAQAQGPAFTLGGKDVALYSRGAGVKTVSPIVAEVPAGAVLDGTLTRADDGLEVAARKPLSGNSLRFDVKEVGYYTLVARLVGADGAILASATNGYAVTPPIPERPDEQGVCLHSRQFERRQAWDIAFDMLGTAGFSRIRDDLTWGRVEPQKGKYRIPASSDRLVEECCRHGIRPLLIFGYPSPAYKDYRKGFPSNETTRVACAEAMVFAVKHFRGKVTEWELWNEPNRAHPVKDYLPLAKTVYPRVKAVAPEITFISCGGAGAGGGIGGGYIRPILRHGGREFQDGWSAHPYVSPHTPDRGYRGGPPLRQASLPCSLAANLKWGKAGKTGEKPLSFWITELGWPDIAVKSEMLQAAYIVRSFLIARAYRLETGLYIYDFQDDGLDPEEKEHHFGIIRHDFSPKPAYQATAVYASLFGNKKTMSCVQPAKDVRVLTCGGKGATVTAVWGVEPTKIEIDWPAPRGNLVMLDWQGRRLPVPEGGTLRLTAGVLPVYFVERVFY